MREYDQENQQYAILIGNFSDAIVVGVICTMNCRRKGNSVTFLQILVQVSKLSLIRSDWEEVIRIREAKNKNLEQT
jgi:hypothetical protein